MFVWGKKQTQKCTIIEVTLKFLIVLDSKKYIRNKAHILSFMVDFLKKWEYGSLLDNLTLSICSFKISKTLMLDLRWDGEGTMSHSFAGPLEY